MPEEHEIAMQGNRYALDVDKAEQVLRRVNSDRMFLVEDLVVAQSFNALRESHSPKHLPVCVTLLDALWKTRMYGIPNEREAICASLENNWQLVTDVLSSLTAAALETAPAEVYAAAEKLFPIILSAPGCKQSNYSFSSKFYHWVTRQHFPIVDGFARKSVSRLQRESGTGNYVIKADSADVPTRQYVREYSYWVRFYADLLVGLSDSDKTRLIKTDYDSQTLPDRMENTLVRILDKVFYGENGRESLIAS